MLIIGKCHCGNIAFTLESRLARRRKNWIADVRISQAVLPESPQ